jgi:hypothetical protein
MAYHSEVLPVTECLPALPAAIPLLPIGRFPAFWQSIRQLWHVKVIPLEIASQKPDTEVEGTVRLRLYGSCPGGG